MNTLTRRRNRVQQEESRRLQSIRSQLVQWSSRTDTSSWESSFFFEILDRKNQEIQTLKRELSRLRNR